MIKSELVQRLARANPHLYQRDIESIVKRRTKRDRNLARRGDRVELRGFGVFWLKRRPARAGRNPRTGAHVSVDKKSVPFFKTGKEMHQASTRLPKGRFWAEASTCPREETLGLRRFVQRLDGRLDPRQVCGCAASLARPA